MNISVKLIDNSEEVLNALDSQIEAGLTAVGMTAESHAKDLAPVDTGRLRNSLTHQVEMSEKAVYVGTNVEYAQFVENGTQRQKAQPYLRPAILDNMDEYKSLIEKALKT